MSKYQTLLLPFASGGECHDIVWAVKRKFPEFVVDSGFFVKWNGEPVDHSWLVEEGTIVDPTYSQFDYSVRVGVWERGTPEHGRYHSYRTHHDPDCLHKLLKTLEPCALYQEGKCDYSATNKD